MSSEIDKDQRLKDAISGRILHKLDLIHERTAEDKSAAHEIRLLGALTNLLAAHQQQ